ncbi:MAG: NAD(+) kinase [Caldithrix sp.]|nr:NAD(+) kinase [Caldithrix sp.]
MNALQTIGIMVNPRKKEVQTSLNSLEQWIAQTNPPARFLLMKDQSPYLKDDYHNIEVVKESELLERSDLIVTLGGDGSILRAVRSIEKRCIPLLGVNLGGLGFLAETSPEKLTNHIATYLANQHFVEERIQLHCSIEGRDHEFHALNDIVIDKAGFSRVIELITYVDGNLLNSYVADAVLISTPTGSTGYSLSAGGPIVIPNTEVFIINPICPHSLTNRPVVVPQDSTITIKVYTEHDFVYLFRDGQMEGDLSSGSSITVKKEKFPVRFVKMKNQHFYETLRNKLNWGEDFRNKDRWSYNDK